MSMNSVQPHNALDGHSLWEVGMWESWSCSSQTPLMQLDFSIPGVAQERICILFWFDNSSIQAFIPALSSRVGGKMVAPNFSKRRFTFKWPLASSLSFLSSTKLKLKVLIPNGAVASMILGMYSRLLWISPAASLNRRIGSIRSLILNGFLANSITFGS